MSGQESAERNIFPLRIYWKHEYYWDTISGEDLNLIVECCGRVLKFNKELARSPERRESKPKFKFERWGDDEENRWSLWFHKLYGYHWGGQNAETSFQLGPYTLTYSMDDEGWRWSSVQYGNLPRWVNRVITKFDPPDR